MWIVVRSDGEHSRHTLTAALNPTTHSTLDKARSEARRLATLHKGCRFYVFSAIGFAQVEDPVRWCDLEDCIPF